MVGWTNQATNLLNPLNLLNSFNLLNPVNLLWPVAHRNVNTTVTVMITATGSPLSVVGVNVH